MILKKPVSLKKNLISICCSVISVVAAMVGYNINCEAANPNDIYSFHERGYNACQAKNAGFTIEQIAKVYHAMLVRMAFDPSPENLQKIKKTLDNNILNFKVQGYYIHEAIEAGFSIEEITQVYSASEVKEEYGHNLSKDNLQKIKIVLNNNIYNFKGKGYTACDAKGAGFDLKEIAKVYRASEIKKEYGHNLSKDNLQKIKQGLYNNIYTFKENGYYSYEAKDADFDLTQIAKLYSAQCIKEVYGALFLPHFKKIKEALGNNIYTFKSKGYLVEDVINAGFTLGQIVEAYEKYTACEAKSAGFELDEIAKVYNATSVKRTFALTPGNLQIIKRWLDNNINNFKEKGYTAREAKGSGFSFDDIEQEYFRSKNCTNFREDLQLYLRHYNVAKINDNLYKKFKTEWRSKDIGDISDTDLFEKIKKLKLTDNPEDNTMIKFLEYLNSSWGGHDKVRYDELSNEQKLMLKLEIVTLENLMKENTPSQNIKDKIEFMKDTISDTSGACEGRLAAIVLEVGN